MQTASRPEQCAAAAHGWATLVLFSFGLLSVDYLGYGNSNIGSKNLEVLPVGLDGKPPSIVTGTGVSENRVAETCGTVDVRYSCEYQFDVMVVTQIKAANDCERRSVKRTQSEFGYARNREFVNAFKGIHGMRSRLTSYYTTGNNRLPDGAGEIVFMGGCPSCSGLGQRGELLSLCDGGRGGTYGPGWRDDGQRRRADVPGRQVPAWRFTALGCTKNSSSSSSARQTAAALPRTSFRDHQGDARLSALLAARPGQRVLGMDAGERGLQAQATLPPGSEAGGCLQAPQPLPAATRQRC